VQVVQVAQVASLRVALQIASVQMTGRI